VSWTIFLQIKNEPTAATAWKKLTAICENKGKLTQLNTLNKLQNLTCLKTNNVQKHIADMSVVQEELAGMGTPVSEQHFTTMIR
jgi:hypothetical protein